MIVLEKHSSTAKQDRVTANSHQLSYIISHPRLIKLLPYEVEHISAQIYSGSTELLFFNVLKGTVLQ